MESMFYYHTSSNGLKSVCRRSSGPVEYFGIAINAGSRDDPQTQHGLAHFVEHTIFKGTSRRHSWHIINRMEAVGGELNAFTTKEETVIYSIFPRGYLNRAIELISDLITDSQFPESEIDKERDVISDEIDSYLDSPADAVFDDFEDLIFKGSSLGHNILGSKESLQTFNSEICKKYIERYYTPENMAAFYMGNEMSDKVFKAIDKHFGCMIRMESHVNRVEPVNVQPFHVSKKIGSHQSHSIIGACVANMYSEERYAVSLLANILGGPGMNSKLNVSLREKRGLVYTTEAFPTFFTDTGLLSLYFGCDPEDNKQCHKLVARILTSMSDKQLSPKAMNASKRQFIGQLILASENKEQMSIAMGRDLLYRGFAIDAETVKQSILDISPEILRSLSERILSENSSLTMH